MKQTITLENTRFSLDTVFETLEQHFSQIDTTNQEHIKLANEYYKWTALKTNLIMNEKQFQIPASALPNTIKPASFNWLRPEKQKLILKYYQFNKETGQYVISVKKNSIPNADIEIIMRSLVLIRKTVLWVDFGYNIGSEFGGRHPAIILKNLKDSLIVIPLSSQEPKDMNYNVKVEKVYGFPLMPRWANITRITQVSLSRCHFEKFGDVKPVVLDEVGKKLSTLGII